MFKSQKQIMCVMLLTAVADFLFYDQVLGGVSLSIYNLMLLVCIAFCEEKFFQNKKILVLALINITLMMANVIHTNFWSVLLCVLSLSSIMMTIKLGWLDNALDWISGWFFNILFFIFCVLDDLPECMQWLKKLPERNILGWLIGVVLSAVFVGLFCLANPIIEEWITYVTRIEVVSEERFLFWLLFVIASWSFMRLSKDRRTKREETQTQIHKDVEPPIPQDKSQSQIFTPQTTVICLRMFNIVFAVQTILDIIYLWGGRALPEGMTYAAYAHRGAYPLVFTVLLAAAFVLITFRKKRSESMRVARFWVYMWLTQNVFLVISSLLRLDLYIEMYHLTRWRIAALIWMGIVAVGLLLILIRIVKDYSNKWLINSNFIAVLCVFYICAFFNIDAYIANYNANNMENTEIFVDINYLESLGVESLPALRMLAKEKNVSGAAQAVQRLQKKLDRQMQNWRSWCYFNASISR
ncbi:DUF4153 domain-containing protein [Candidatus Uabimicrobium amorphum]|uniref:Uncharacterized protein n=1 Tax=Uabimicrobium amorphum TaxID=2596890 RepID=A0A5S9ISK0_UABAM|nr:DUF4173 domain-containing protein [Candidatus Uabimicrobium amorphum]BBM87329.1 hypothetical protein UABAM_05738 [Candidatus Uabimicrobium amorphum]